MKVKIKRLTPNSVIPSYAKNGDAGLDLTATSKFFDECGNICYGIGLAFEIPQGYVGLVFPRSSVSKKQLNLANAVAVTEDTRPSRPEEEEDPEMELRRSFKDARSILEELDRQQSGAVE